MSNLFNDKTIPFVLIQRGKNTLKVRKNVI